MNLSLFYKKPLVWNLRNNSKNGIVNIVNILLWQLYVNVDQRNGEVTVKKNKQKITTEKQKNP